MSEHTYSGARLRLALGTYGAVCLEGEVDAGNAQTFAALLADAMAKAPRPLRLELGGLDLLDAAAVAAAMRALREIAAREPVTVAQAPQWLAHGLYRINALSALPITLEAPREELPGAN